MYLDIECFVLLMQGFESIHIEMGRKKTCKNEDILFEIFSNQNLFFP